MRGAWIEIDANKEAQYYYIGRSPCGERGLKSQAGALYGYNVLSLPVRGAWIEIIAGTDGTYDITSLPVRGAWIEMVTARF